jgi:hypothetical protein
LRKLRRWRSRRVQKSSGTIGCGWKRIAEKDKEEEEDGPRTVWLPLLCLKKIIGEQEKETKNKKETKVNEGKRGRRRKRNGSEQFQSQMADAENCCMNLGCKGRSGVDQKSFGPPLLCLIWWRIQSRLG